MGKQYDHIGDDLADFLHRQRMFFVATAPIDQNGHINVSPKGLNSFRVLDAHTVAYVDLVGSGVETVAHLKENGRIVLMFCAFEGTPKIVRLHGRGDVIEHSHPQFTSLIANFPEFDTVRAIICVHCSRISDSCGFGVPRFEFQEQRSELIDWASSKSEEKLLAYQQRHNSQSIDGLAALSTAFTDKRPDRKTTS